MNKENEYFVSFYGDLEGVREDLSNIASSNPRCVETKELILSTFTTSLTLLELGTYLSKENRLYSLVEIFEDKNPLFIHFGETLNAHLSNKVDDYKVSQVVDLKKNEILKINSIDPITKDKLINDLLNKYKTTELSEMEKSILKKLVDDEE